jgi:hypothetical protein
LTATQPSRPQKRALTVPVLNVNLPVPEIHIPNPQPIAAPAAWVAQTALTRLPRKDQLLYYGGLGLLGLAGVVEWPVAAVAAAGVWIATRSQRRPAETR